MIGAFVLFFSTVQNSVSFSPCRLRPSPLLEMIPPDLSGDEEASTIGIGIDLGTTRSAVAVVGEDGVPAIIPVPENGYTIPSVVSFGLDGDVWVGEEACFNEKTMGAYRNVKRVLGTGGKLPMGVIQGVPFIAPSQKGKTFKKNSIENHIMDAVDHPTKLRSSTHPDQTIDPRVISTHILRKLVETVEEATGKNVTRAVIGIPAYFHDGQREATKQAAADAGISKVKLLREPEAAALAYSVGKQTIGTGDQDELVLVFDLGGGTYDVSMLIVGNGVTEILCTSGNAQLGGSNFDSRIAAFLSSLVSGGTSKWPEKAKNALVLLAEQARIYLSNSKVVKLALPLNPQDWITSNVTRQAVLPLNFTLDGEEITESGRSNGTHILCSLTRSKAEQLCFKEFQALLRPIREVAIMAGALLPGDSSPAAVESVLKDFTSANNEVAFHYFYDQEEETPCGENSLLAIRNTNILKRVQQKSKRKARRVAREEAKYRQEARKLSHTTTTTSSERKATGINGRPISRVVLVGGATRMPAIGRLLTAVTGIVPQRTVNPDEAVALGCAVQVGMLDGKAAATATVLSPMQAAILRAVAENEGLLHQPREGDDGEGFENVEFPSQ